MRTQFLKLGGSLLTDKRHAEAPRMDVIDRLAAEIAQARALQPELRLVVGHGSGSYGHVAGQRHGTRDGVHTAQEWRGFAETADAAARLNRIVVAALLDAGMPAWGIQPSVALRCEGRRIAAGPQETIAAALEGGLLPVIYGDVALDSQLGGTIAGTEEIFAWLLPYFRPQRVILAGEVDGIYSADPQLEPSAVQVAEVRSGTLAAIESGLGGSHGVDVTGGMLAKARQALSMATAQPGLEVLVCSGLIPGVMTALLTDPACVRGTRIVA